MGVPSKTGYGEAREIEYCVQRKRTINYRRYKK